MQISSKNQTDKELQVVKIVEELLRDYDFPIFTDKVVVESGVIPHSHPVLTLNTRVLDNLQVLKVLVHEQLHWFATDHPKYDETIEYLKGYYEDNGECNVSGNYPDSFWEHIVVCWNTRNILSVLLSLEDIRHIYSQWQPYPITEELVYNNSKEIEKHLKSFDFIAPTSTNSS